MVAQSGNPDIREVLDSTYSLLSNECSNVVEIYDGIMYVCVIKMWGWGYGAHGSVTTL